MPTTTIIRAIEMHPSLMSPVLLEHLLRGEVIGRMSEKGLLTSPFFGALASMCPAAIGGEISRLRQAGEIFEASGFYPALCPKGYQGPDVCETKGARRRRLGVSAR